MIPLFRPSCSDLEIGHVTEVLRSGWWGMGAKTEELEEKFARYVGARYAVAMSSATMALQLTWQALGVRDGEIIMPALTFASTALAVIRNGCTPVFADIDEDTLCIDWDDAAGKSADPAGIIPVWYGGVVDLPGVLPSAWVVEDCAHAAGSENAGRYGDAACWSFNAVKNLAAGDGGMVTTRDPGLALRLRELRRFGIRKTGSRSWDYEIPEAGWKADMSDIVAAVALAQLSRLDEMNSKRRDIVRVYLDQMKDLGWLRLPEWREGSSWHMFVVRADRRDKFIDHMMSNGVSAGVHYRPLNQYDIFGKCQLPVTDRVWETLVTLPLYPDMTDGDVSKVIGAVRSFR